MFYEETRSSFIAGVIAIVMLSILVFRCRKRDRDAGRRLLVLVILVLLHTIELFLCVLIPNRPFLNLETNVSFLDVALQWLGSALNYIYVLSFPGMFLYLLCFLNGNDRTKLVIWEGAAIFAFYLLVVFAWLSVMCS